MINRILKISAISIYILILVSCSSKLEKEQRIVQQEYTKKTANLVKEHLNSLSQTLSNYLNIQDDVNENNYENLKLKFNEISAIILQNTDGEIIKIVPGDLTISDIKSEPFNNDTIKSIIENKEIQLYPIILREDNNYLCLSMPLPNEKQNSTNIVSVLMNSKNLFEPISRKSFFPTPYSLSIINKDKIILYNPDNNKIGLDFTFGDKSYPIITLKELFKKMMENNADYFITSSMNKDSKSKKLFTWYSISILDSKWWISLTREIWKSSRKKSSDTYLLSSLRSYAVKDTLIDAIFDNDMETVQGILEEIYQLNPMTYAIQIADRNGTVVSGWPPENCAVGYSYKMKKKGNFDNALRDILRDKEEKIINSHLIEGGEGRFILIPITVNDEIIGVLYSIKFGRG